MLRNHDVGCVNRIAFFAVYVCGKNVNDSQAFEPSHLQPPLALETSFVLAANPFDGTCFA